MIDELVYAVFLWDRRLKGMSEVGTGMWYNAPNGVEQANVTKCSYLSKFTNLCFKKAQRID